MNNWVELDRTLEQVRDEAQVAAELHSALEDLQGLLDRHKDFCKKLEEALARVNRAKARLRVFQDGSDMDGAITIDARFSGQKSNVEIFEEVLRHHGKPMHVRDIVTAAQERGVVLRGKNRPTLQVRNALYSSKRFINTGSNIWWLLGEPIPQPSVAQRVHEDMYVLDGQHRLSALPQKDLED